MSPPTDRGSQRPTIYDVARRAGVSHQTVSRVLNDHPHIRESTRARVLQAMDEMNYTPSSIARILATRQSRRIGVLIDGRSHHGVDRTLLAVETAARDVGYSVSAFSISDQDSPQIVSGVVELVTRGAEGLCVIAPHAFSLDSLGKQNIGLPTIVITAEADSSRHTVGVDQREGARLAVQHLIDLGHRTIAHLSGPVDCSETRQRGEGWRECLAEAGLPRGPIVTGDGTSDFGFQVGRSDELGDATAVFAANDQMALGVIHGLHRRGIRVPEDVSVVGFDDSPDARHFRPPLTTIGQDSRALGEVTLQRLVAAIEDEVEPSRSVIPPRLIARESTATAPERRDP